MNPEITNLEQLPLSLLNDFLYCARRAALKAVEGVRAENKHTVLGDIVHGHADLAGYEVGRGVTVLRALPVWSERLGVSGKCDVVEVHPHPGCGHGLPSDGRGGGDAVEAVENPKSQISNPRSQISTAKAGISNPESEGRNPKAEIPNPKFQISNPESQIPDLKSQIPDLRSQIPDRKCQVSNLKSLVPVEYKKGKRRAFANDDAQLCAQGMCLEEMFGRPIGGGAVFHAASKRRREVEFTGELRALVERSLGELRGMIEARRVPPAVFKAGCEECSLFEICLPRAASEEGRAGRLARQLFQI